jgi:hypothetical protein
VFPSPSTGEGKKSPLPWWERVGVRGKEENNMAKIDITKTELVWPWKYNKDGTRKEVERISLPFQVIETVNRRQQS